MTIDLEALRLYEGFRDALCSRWPQCTVKVSKTQVSFTDGVGFAFVSRPPKKTAGAIMISLGLRAPLDSPRVFAQTEPYPGRWTVHIIVHNISELDPELLGWMEEAHEYAVERGLRRGRK